MKKFLPAGSVEIALAYEGPVELNRFEIYVIDDPTFCDDPYYLVPPEDAINEAELGSRLDTHTVGPLLAGDRVSVMVRGRVASNGVLAAGGCEGDIIVLEDETRRIEVPVFLLPLNPAGTYTLRNHFDFSGAIPGTIGDVIQSLVRFFGDQNNERQIATVLFDAVEELVRQAVGGAIAAVIGAVTDWIDDDLNDLINGYIDNEGPQWLRDFFTVGSDVISIVSNMEVISTMRIGKPRSDGTFDGSQNWVGVAFYWRLPCERAGDMDPDCGRYEFTMEQLEESAEGIELVFGQFTGRVHTYDQGIIDEHTMDLQYGRLILFVINNIVLPEIADGATNLTDGLLNLANCPGFADRITDGQGRLRFLGVTIARRDRIEGWCESAMGLVGTVATAILNRLRLDTRLTLEGDMTFLESTDDLVVDEIIDGVWSGSIRTANDQGPPFEGDFAGPRE